MPPDWAEGSVLVNLNDLLEAAAVAFEVAILGLLVYRHSWRTLPFFCLFCAWELTSDCGDYLVSHYLPNAYLTTYFVDLIVNSVLQFCVLVELAWSVFRPFRASLPKHTVWILGILIAVAGAAIWPFAVSSAFARFSVEWHILGRLQQTDSILRILFFLLLAGCSQMLSIGWRDRELQVATGLGFYSLVSLTVTMLHAHMEAGPAYRRLDQLQVACYVCSLLYWIVCFAQKEAERREFTPQMQGLLLAMAGSARSTRISMTGSGRDKTGKRGPQ